MNRIKFFIILLGLAATVRTVQAFTATSTSFLVHQNIQSISGGNSTYSQSTSTSFNLTSAGQQLALGTSTSATKQVLSGFLRSMMESAKPTYEQIHYHWRNDNGSESAATSGTSGTQDTATSSISKLAGKRLRVEIANTGGTVTAYSAQQFRIEYGLLSSTCSAISSWVDVGAVGGDWDMFNSTNLTEGSDTTNIAISIGGVTDANANFMGTGGQRDTTSQTTALYISSFNFIEIEYSMQATSAATDGATYCFRTTNAGSATNFTYTIYPQATITAGALTFTTDSATKSLGNHSPGTLSFATSSLYVTTSNSSGFNVTVMRDDSDTTMDLDSDASKNITDKTAWASAVSTTTTANATASTTEPNSLQFRVNLAGTDTPNYASTWWGTADTTAAALFAGFPSTAKTIINRSTAAASQTTSIILYNLNTPVTQATGAYSGSITYTTVANP